MDDAGSERLRTPVTRTGASFLGEIARRTDGFSAWVEACLVILQVAAALLRGVALSGTYQFLAQIDSSGVKDWS